MDVFYGFFNGYFLCLLWIFFWSAFRSFRLQPPHSLPLEVLILNCDHYAKGNLWKIHCQVLLSSLQSA